MSPQNFITLGKICQPGRGRSKERLPGSDVESIINVPWRYQEQKVGRRFSLKVLDTDQKQGICSARFQVARDSKLRPFVLEIKVPPETQIYQCCEFEFLGRPEHERYLRGRRFSRSDLKLLPVLVIAVNETTLYFVAVNKSFGSVYVVDGEEFFSQQAYSYSGELLGFGVDLVGDRAKINCYSHLEIGSLSPEEAVKLPLSTFTFSEI